MWAIAAVALVGVAIFFERLLAVIGLVGQAQQLDRRMRDAVMAGNMPELLNCCAKAPGGVAAVLMRGVESSMRGANRDEILAEMSRDGRRFAFKLRRGIAFLGTLGSMSPFVGLFGTVLGIMDALHRIGQSGSGGLDVVATGVSEALVTTAAGIMVAICMVLLHSILRGQLNRAVMEVQVLVEDAADYLARMPPQRLESRQRVESPIEAVHAPA